MEEQVEEMYFRLLSKSNMDETTLQEIRDQQNSSQPIFDLQTKRSGKKLEHLEVLLEVASASDMVKFEKGIYKSQIGDIAIFNFISMINVHVNKKEQVERINVHGTIKGIADANLVNELTYNNDIGNIELVEYQNETGGKRSRMTIAPSSKISNLQLAFLRAYNAYQLVQKGLFIDHPQVEKNIQLIAKDDKVNEGYDYRKVTINLKIENYYLWEYEQLPPEVKQEVIK